MKNKILKYVFTIILAITVCGAAIFSGCVFSSRNWFENTVNKYYYYPVEEGAFEQTDRKKFAESYLDIYSAYYTADEYEAVIKSNSGSKSGIGISYSYVQDKGIYIASVVGNSPAYMCGLRAGEWLESGSAAGRDEVVFSSAKDFEKLINSVGDGVKLKLNSADGEGEYTVAKAEYTASYTYMSTNQTAWVFGDSADGGLALYEKKSERKSELPDGAAYICLSQFYGSAPKEFYALIEKFNATNCNSLILDLRSDGGGYVSVMQEIAGSFAGGEKKLAMLSRDKNGKEEKFYCEKVGKASQRVSEDTDVYVMANSGTASASEALIGAMICYGALEYKNIFLSQYSDEYIGWLEESGQEVKTGRSYGKGIMQSTFVNGRTHEALKLTTAKIYWPDTVTCIHDKGLTVADGCTPVYAEWQQTKTDNELKEVVDIIKTKS